MDSRKRTWIYAGLALAAGVGLVSVMSSSDKPTLPGAPPPGPPGTKRVLRPGDRVLLVGDSLAQGLTKPMAQLASDMGVSFLGDGRVSTRIDQWASQPWLAGDLTLAPTFVLVSLGTNDMKLFDPALETPFLKALVAKLRATGARLVWILPPVMPFPDKGVLAMIAATGMPLFHSEALVLPRGSDQIHPTSVGYAGWAGAIWSFLRRGVEAMT